MVSCMAETAQAPALPWARTDATGSSSGPTYIPQLAPGQRIEVRWELFDEESGKNSIKWWGASVSQQQPAEGNSLWKLRYVASEGFEEEEAGVTFLCERYLRSEEDRAVLQWRIEGSPKEDEDEEEDNGEETVVLGEISAAYEEMEREMGQTMEEAAMQELQTLEPLQQRMLLSGFTDYMNNVKAQLREIVDQKDENYVVTEGDVQQILQSVKRNRQS